ncbi:MAG: DUF952 domain-containing protein [Aggregatilineales bacterium]
MKYIYHITTQQAWDDAQKAGVYTAPSLETEGFIHCSTLQQVIPVANAFYKDVPDLLLLEIEVDRLESEIKWEAPAHPDPDNPPDVDDREQFPHVYGVIDVDAVYHTSRIAKVEKDHYLSYEMRLIANKEHIADPVEFLSSIVSELRSSVTPIKGFSQLLLLDKIPPEDHKQIYSVLEENADHIFDLIHVSIRMIRYFREQEQENRDDS